MQLSLLRDEEGLQRAQQRSSLFFDDCRPDLSQEDAVFAVVYDPGGSILAVLCQRFPFSTNPVDVQSLVVADIDGVHKMARFLADLQHHHRDFMSGIRLGGAVTHPIHLLNGLSFSQVAGQFSRYHFKNTRPDSA
jgi:hypothetical protein